MPLLRRLVAQGFRHQGAHLVAGERLAEFAHLHLLGHHRGRERAGEVALDHGLLFQFLGVQGVGLGLQVVLAHRVELGNQFSVLGIDAVVDGGLLAQRQQADATRHPGCSAHAVRHSAVVQLHREPQALIQLGVAAHHHGRHLVAVLVHEVRRAGVLHGALAACRGVGAQSSHLGGQHGGRALLDWNVRGQLHVARQAKHRHRPRGRRGRGLGHLAGAVGPPQHLHVVVDVQFSLGHDHHAAALVGEGFRGVHRQPGRTRAVDDERVHLPTVELGDGVLLASRVQFGLVARADDPALHHSLPARHLANAEARLGDALFDVVDGGQRDVQVHLFDELLRRLIGLHALRPQLAVAQAHHLHVTVGVLDARHAGLLQVAHEHVGKRGIQLAADPQTRLFGVVGDEHFHRVGHGQHRLFAALDGLDGGVCSRIRLERQQEGVDDVVHHAREVGRTDRCLGHPAARGRDHRAVRVQVVLDVREG